MAVIDKGGPVGASYDTKNPEELAYALRQWEHHISRASWGLDSALHALRVANANGDALAIAAAGSAVRSAEKCARDVWELLT